MAIKRAGLTPEQIDVWEVHEAFAQALGDLRELPNQLDGFEIPDEKLNPNGGAVAIGHPFGSSGTRYVLTLATELRERNVRYGVARRVRRLGPRCRTRSGKPLRGLTARLRDNVRITWFDGHKQPPSLSAWTGSIRDRHGLIAESGRTSSARAQHAYEKKSVRHFDENSANLW